MADPWEEYSQPVKGPWDEYAADGGIGDLYVAAPDDPSGLPSPAGGPFDDTMVGRLIDDVSDTAAGRFISDAADTAVGRAAARSGERIDNVVRTAADMFTFGYADEIAARANEEIGVGDYKTNVAAERKRDENIPTSHQVLGTAAALPVAAAGAVPRAIAKFAAKSAPRLVGTSAAGGGLYGTGSGTEGDRLQTGAMTAAMGGALPVVPYLAKIPPVKKALQAAGRGAGRVFSPIKSQLSKNEQNVVDIARRMGIPMTAGQETGNKALRNMEGRFLTMPFTGGPQSKIYREQREAFNRSVWDKAGVDASDISPETMRRVQGDFGSEFDALEARTMIAPGQKFFDTLDDVRNSYRMTGLSPDNKTIVEGYMESLEPLRTAFAKGQKPIIGGAKYKELTTPIRKRAREAANKGDTSLEEALKGIIKAFDDAVDEGAMPFIPGASRDLTLFGSPAGTGKNVALPGTKELQGEWKNLRRRYRNYSTIKDAAGRARQADAGASDIPFGGLDQAVKRSDKQRYVFGTSDLSDSNRVGQFLGGAVPRDSGTAQNALMQRMLMGGGLIPGLGGAAGGAGIGIATDASPWEIAGLALGGAVMPRGVQKAYNSRILQRYLKNQAARQTGPSIKTISRGSR